MVVFGRRVLDGLSPRGARLILLVEQRDAAPNIVGNNATRIHHAHGTERIVEPCAAQCHDDAVKDLRIDRFATS